jgi:hypothetical protein
MYLIAAGTAVFKEEKRSLFILDRNYAKLFRFAPEVGRIVGVAVNSLRRC